MTLPELIAALEQAEGPSRELDYEMALFVGWRSYHGEGVRHPRDGLVGPDTHWAGHWHAPEDGECIGYACAVRDAREPPPYTSSVDSALTLVPAGWGAIIYTEGSGAELYDAGRNRRIGIQYRAFDAATPALALCIAALKARLATEQSNG